MLKTELEKLYIETPHGIFTPLYTSDKPIPIENDDVDIIDYNLPNYIQTKTAEEVYQKYLDDIANPAIPKPTTEEKLRADIEYLSAMTGVKI